MLKFGTCSRFKYKDEYEKFKLILSIIGFALAVINLCVRFRWVFTFWNNCSSIHLLVSILEIYNLKKNYKSKGFF